MPGAGTERHSHDLTGCLSVVGSCTAASKTYSYSVGEPATVRRQPSKVTELRQVQHVRTASEKARFGHIVGLAKPFGKHIIIEARLKQHVAMHPAYPLRSSSASGQYHRLQLLDPSNACPSPRTQQPKTTENSLVSISESVPDKVWTRNSQPNLNLTPSGTYALDYGVMSWMRYLDFFWSRNHELH